MGSRVRCMSRYFCSASGEIFVSTTSKFTGTRFWNEKQENPFSPSELFFSQSDSATAAFFQLVWFASGLTGKSHRGTNSSSVRRCRTFLCLLLHAGPLVSLPHRPDKHRCLQSRLVPGGSILSLVLHLVGGYRQPTER